MQVPVSCHCLVSLFVFVAPSAFVMDMQTGRQINRRLSLPVSCVTCTFRRALSVVSRACFVSCRSRGSVTRHAPRFGNMPSTPEMKIRMRKSSHLKREREEFWISHAWLVCQSMFCIFFLLFRRLGVTSFCQFSTSSWKELEISRQMSNEWNVRCQTTNKRKMNFSSCL